jgi:peptidyl-tRNA hydrolase
VAETPYELRRLQVSGTELPDLAAAPVGAPGAPVFWLNSGARMSAGKAMAQVGHAGMLLAAFASAGELAGWLAAGLPVTVRDADAARWARLIAGPTDPLQRYEADGRVCVRDAGFTEVEPGTVTVVAEWASR